MTITTIRHGTPPHQIKLIQAEYIRPDGLISWEFVVVKDDAVTAAKLQAMQKISDRLRALYD